MPTDADPLLARCRFRVSRRSRHLRITVSARNGLTVTRPPHVSLAQAAAFVDSRREWIERQMAKLDVVEPATPPQTLHLRLTDESLQVQYIETPRTAARLHEAANRLTLHLDPERPENGRAALRAWLKRRAHAALEPRLKQLSTGLALPYNQLSLRLQRTRWGSCSNRRNISLNAKLLFLPEPLVRHVLIHELAHTVHLDHSAAFWALVERHDPHWRTHRDALRGAGPLVPAWLEEA
jgi:predicted metal-dependent hydrolase